MDLIIKNQKFNLEMGVKILKLNNTECPYPELSEMWGNYEHITFKEIAAISNVEHRRVALDEYGLERLEQDVNPTLVSKETVRKKTRWINSKGNVEVLEYDDTYELYMVDKKVLDNNQHYYLKFKDTSTDRNYLLWVDMKSVFSTNFPDVNIWEFNYSLLDAIHAIAWTIQTKVPKGQIESIVRQGDCSLFKKKPNTTLLDNYRHLTKEEYLNLLTAES